MKSDVFFSFSPRRRGSRGNHFVAHPWAPAVAGETRFLAVAGLLLLAACKDAPRGDWAKPGADAGATSSAYQECLSLAGTATRSDSDIEQDIAASRGSDLQHSPVVREQSRMTTEGNSERADAILASCMQAKGFTRGK